MRKEAVEQVLDQLNERERLVIKLRYGLNLSEEERNFLLTLPSQQKYKFQIEGGRHNTLEVPARSSTSRASGSGRSRSKRYASCAIPSWQKAEGLP